MARAIDADKAMEVAQIKYNDWNLAMAAADGQREINLCFKKQELFKAVKAVLDCVPTLTPPMEQKSKLIAQQAAELERRDTLLKEQEAELEQVKRERDEAIKTIFKWTGCPECKYWNSAEEWCEKHDREAGSCDGCDSPQWRGPDKEE